MKPFFRALLVALLSLGSLGHLFADTEPPHPEGLLLRGFESQAAANRRGFSAVANGVFTTMRVDAAGELSASQSAADLAPLVAWYQDREQYYAAYATFGPGVGDAIGFLETEVSSAGKTIDLDGAEDGICLFLPEAYNAIVTVAKAYVDAGVDAIEYDTSWVHGGAGPFDSSTMGLFRDWLNANFSLAELQTYVDATYDASTFDYKTFLNDGGITAANYSGASFDGTPLFQTRHWRLWQAFLRAEEREVIADLVDEVNTYAMSELGHEVGFYFNRYGFINRPADRWYLAEFASGDLGETHFGGQTWDFHEGYSLEPVFRAALKTFDNRFEPWNSPPQITEAVQSVFLAETIANNGVATWEDDYASTAPIARLARRYAAQLDHPAVSDVAIFYPLATVNHNRELQSTTQPELGGSHYWYLGLGYLMQDLNLQYDVAFAGDGLGMPDAFSAADLSGYAAVLVAEAIQTTDSQFTEVLDWVNAGGTLLVMGTDNFRYDALGDDQSGSRSYGAHSWSDLFGSVGSTTVGSGTVQVLSLNAWGSTYYSSLDEEDGTETANLATIQSGVSTALPSAATSVSHDASGDVRILRYRDASDGSEVYHLLNYSFSSYTSVTTQSSFDVTVPEPSTFVGTAVAEYATSADSDPVSLSITDNGDGTLTVTIPSLTYWGILRIGSAIDDSPHPAIAPVAELTRLFDYEAYRSDASRDLTFSAASDSNIASVQVFYQLYDGNSGTFGSWTAGTSTSGNGTNELLDETLTFNFPSVGRYRLQLVATDSDGDSNALIDGSYDTEIGYDTTVTDLTDFEVTVNSGPSDGGVTTSPVAPSLSLSGAADDESGIFQVNYAWVTESETLDGAGVPYEEGMTVNLSAPTEGAYDTYRFTVRFQNNAQIWDDEPSVVYSYIYTAAPTYNGSYEDQTSYDGDTVQFDLAYTNPYGDVTIAWYKDDVLLEGETENGLVLQSVTAADNGTYHAVITNPAGSIVSTDFDLTVLTLLEITSQPSGAEINEGETFTVTVEATGTGTLTYQWKLEGVDIPGATSASYSVSNAVRADDHGHYTCVVGDDTGETVTSNGAFVQIATTGGGGGGTGAFNINVNVVDGASFTLSVLGTDLLDDLRARIVTSGGLSDDVFHLYRGDSELTGNNALSTYGIVSGSVLTVSETPLSGGGGGSFNITINIPESDPLVIDVVDTDVVSDLRTRVATDTGLSGDDFDLLFGATNITDTPESTLGSFGIESGSILNLVLTGGGGGGETAIDVTVNVPDSAPIVVSVLPSDTVSTLVSKVATETAMTEGTFDLLYGATNLTDSPAATLDSLSVTDGAIVNLVVTGGGGGGSSLSLTVTIPFSADLNLTMAADDLVSDLRALIATNSGRDGSTFTLWMGETELTNESATLTGAGLSDGDTVSVHLNDISVTFESPDGLQSMDLTIAATLTVGEMYDAVATSLSVSKDTLTLTFDGSELANMAQSLIAAGVGDGSTVIVEMVVAASITITIDLPEAVGSDLSLEVSPSDTLSTLGGRIESEVALGGIAFSLSLGETELTNGEATLDSLGVVDGSTIVLTLPPASTISVSILQDGMDPQSVDVAGDATVEDLYTAVATALSLAPEDFILEFGGFELADDLATLSSLAIGEGSSITLKLETGALLILQIAGQDDLYVHFPLDDTVANLALLLITETGIPEGFFELSFDATPLDTPSATLTSYGIVEDSTIVVNVLDAGLTYEGYAAEIFGDAIESIGPWDDFDLDGMENFLEYFFGLDATVDEGTEDSLFTLRVTNGEAYVTWPQRKDVSDATVAVRISTDGGATWSDATASDFVETRLPTGDDAVEEVRWTYQKPLNGILFVQGSLSQAAQK